jgi:hypothetical protein
MIPPQGPPAGSPLYGLIPRPVLAELAYLLTELSERDQRGALAGAALVLDDGTKYSDAALTAHLILTDLDHCLDHLAQTGRPLPPERWATLLGSLRKLLQALRTPLPN